MYRFLFSISFFLLLSCGEKLMEKPDNLIPRDKMVAILKDLAIVNAAKNTNAVLLRENNIEPMHFIFTKYGIDSVQFVESDTYYASLPVEYEEIYKKVNADLEKEKIALEAAQKVQDSIEQIEKAAEREKKKAAPIMVKDSLP